MLFRSTRAVLRGRKLWGGGGKAGRAFEPTLFDLAHSRHEDHHKTPSGRHVKVSLSGGGGLVEEGGSRTDLLWCDAGASSSQLVEAPLQAREAPQSSPVRRFRSRSNRSRSFGNGLQEGSLLANLQRGRCVDRWCFARSGGSKVWTSADGSLRAVLRFGVRWDVRHL